MAFLCEAIRPTVGVQCKFHLLTILILQIKFHHGSSQQPYLNNKQYDCYVNHTNTLGYTCNGPPNCTSYFTFRTTANYSTVPNIAFLLSADADSIAQANSVTDVASFPEGHLLFVPVNCSCNKHYHHNATYKIKVDLEVYENIANNTYEGLTTCQAMMATNDYNSHKLSVGDVLVAPLMCACPSTNQTSIGFNYIVSYLATWMDTIAGIADLFGVDQQTILDANELSSTSTIYPFNPLLVPLKTNPTKINLNPSSPPPPPSPPPPAPGLDHRNGRKFGEGHLPTIVSISSVAVLLLLFTLAFWFYLREKKTKKALEDVRELTAESLQMDLSTIRIATQNFAADRKLGQGGFGEVYKGTLENGQDIAVKRLSRDSGQGVAEFKTEVLLVAKLQHRNLVKLLGFCASAKEKILVYEYLPNSSLDRILFDPVGRASLNWETRFKIIFGIAKGLLYLHEDSRLRIVHRDLKTSNILLDEAMNPKIADFGLARLFGVDQTQDATNTIVGTYGYMAPEYILTGHYSVKSDVYTFGIIVLEVVSGQRNKYLNRPNLEEAILHRAWRLWTEDAQLELVDETLGERYSVEDVMKCIHVGLLCIQENVARRPNMTTVVAALGGQTIKLPAPMPPNFLVPNDPVSGTNTSTSGSNPEQGATSVSTVSDITVLDAR